ncbi:hypothetical protein TTRE_0000032001 [Trichuris trichiura]|uniref:Uncharacterized protein n=1 Tax=Trichuris trichiura TaxID=36087 RepID=A0A077YW78_TRITR|nr:hypothetical protein TTRE_0000032001 [Trichuris trichiura]
MSAWNASQIVPFQESFDSLLLFGAAQPHGHFQCLKVSFGRQPLLAFRLPKDDRI